MLKHCRSTPTREIIGSSNDTKRVESRSSSVPPLGTAHINNMPSQTYAGDQCLLVVRASVMYYHDTQKKWVSCGSPPAGISKVHMYFNPSTNQYRIYACKVHDQEVVLDGLIKPGIKYNEATPLFHQWKDSKQVYGLNFASKEDASQFSDKVKSAIEITNQQHDYASTSSSNSSQNFQTYRSSNTTAENIEERLRSNGRPAAPAQQPIYEQSNNLYSANNAAPTYGQQTQQHPPTDYAGSPLHHSTQPQKFNASGIQGRQLPLQPNYQQYPEQPQYQQPREDRQLLQPHREEMHESTDNYEEIPAFSMGVNTTTQYSNNSHYSSNQQYTTANNQQYSQVNNQSHAAPPPPPSTQPPCINSSVPPPPPPAPPMFSQAPPTSSSNQVPVPPPIPATGIPTAPPAPTTSLAAAIQGAQLKKTSPAHRKTEGAVPVFSSGSDLMAEMQKKLAKRRAQASGEAVDTLATSASSSRSGSPRQTFRKLSTTNNSTLISGGDNQDGATQNIGQSGNRSAEWEAMKQEILEEMRAEIQKVKKEILDVLRT